MRWIWRRPAGSRVWGSCIRTDRGEIVCDLCRCPRVLIRSEDCRLGSGRGTASVGPGCNDLPVLGWGAPRGCLRLFSRPSGHGARRGSGGFRAHGGEPPPRRLALEPHVIGDIQPTGTQRIEFVEEMHHTCRQIRAPETLPTPAGTASCDHLLRPEAMNRFITRLQLCLYRRVPTPISAPDSFFDAAGVRDH
jgi:hypothetical protein